MRKLATIAAATAVLGLAGPAAAQSYFSCQQVGSGSGLYRLNGQSISLWRPGEGWTGNLCAGDRNCYVTADTIQMDWETRREHAFHYAVDTFELSINRRSGTASLRHVRVQRMYDGVPYPRFSNGRTTSSPTGRCAAAEDPEAGPALF